MTEISTPRKQKKLPARISPRAAPIVHLDSIAYEMDRQKRENRPSRAQTVLACFNPASYDAA
jgi:hypothetical protein